jgi:hypothetical protein
MTDFDIEKVFEVKPVSDKDSKKEFLKKKGKSKNVKEEDSKNETQKGCVVKDGHVDCYA